MRIRHSHRLAAALLLTSSLTACLGTGITLGQGGSPVTGSAGDAGTQGANSTLQRCDRPVATIALVEQQIPALAQYGLTSPIPVIRLLMAQSGCFTVVERGQALGRLEQERALMSSGQLRRDSNMGGGQMLAADYYITPNVVFSENDAGGVGGVLGGLFGPIGGLAAAGLKFKEAQVLLFVTDTRTSAQTGAAEGSARSSDLSAGAAALAGLGGGALGGGIGAYQNTNQGKVVAAAMLDAVNKLVPQLRVMKAQR